MSNAKVVVLFSGGLDSTVLLGKMVAEFGATNVTALSLLYGQKHDKELVSAQRVAISYGVELIQHDISSLFSMSNSSLLKHSTDELPTGDYASQLEGEEITSSFVPFRNGLFLSAAASIAYSLGASIIVYGAHADDSAGSAYPDCSEEFVRAMDESIRVGTGNKVILLAPFLRYNKAQIVATGLEISAPLYLSWSCYEGEELACGVCGTCVDRLKAFDLNGVSDPIAYAGEIAVPVDGQWRTGESVE